MGSLERRAALCCRRIALVLAPPTRLLINRSLVYGMLTGFVVGICVVAVGLSSALLQRQESWLLSMLL